MSFERFVKMQTNFVLRGLTFSLSNLVIIILDINLVFLQFVTCLFISVFYRQEALSSAVSEKDAHLQWLEVTFEHRQIFCDSMSLYNLLLYLQFYSYLRATRLLVRGAATRTRAEPWRGCAGRGGTCSTG